MNNAKLYTELESAKLFQAYGKEVQEKYGFEKNPACVGNWLIRDNFTKPFLTDPFVWLKDESQVSFDEQFQSILLRKATEKISDLTEFKQVVGNLLELRDRARADGETYLKAYGKGPKWNGSNEDFENQGFASYFKRFSARIYVPDVVDEDGRDAVFKVEYGMLKADQCPYFKTTYNSSQEQYLLEKDAPDLYDFYQDWERFDGFGSALTLEEFEAMKQELQEVAKNYQRVEWTFPEKFGDHIEIVMVK